MKRGSALLGVLMVLLAGAAVAMLALTRQRDAIRGSVNRSARVRNEWLGVGCAAHALSILDLAVSASSSPPPGDSLSLLIARSTAVAECPGSVVLRAGGGALPIHIAGGTALRELLVSAGIAIPTADSVTQAISDWIDEDETRRERGCESPCYAALEALPPRNARLVSAAELLLVRGMPTVDSQLRAGTGSGVADYLSVDDDRVSIRVATFPVLAALPGIGRRGAAAILERRAQGPWHPSSLQEVAALLGRADRDSLLAAAPWLSRVAMVEPEVWHLRVTVPAVRSDGPMGNAFTLDMRLRLGAEGIGVLERRTGP